MGTSVCCVGVRVTVRRSSAARGRVDVPVGADPGHQMASTDDGSTGPQQGGAEQLRAVSGRAAGVPGAELGVPPAGPVPVRLSTGRRRGPAATAGSRGPGPGRRCPWRGRRTRPRRWPPACSSGMSIQSRTITRATLPADSDGAEPAGVQRGVRAPATSRCGCTSTASGPTRSSTAGCRVAVGAAEHPPAEPAVPVGQVLRRVRENRLQAGDGARAAVTQIGVLDSGLKS